MSEIYLRHLKKLWSFHILKRIAPRGESVEVLQMLARVSSSVTVASSSEALVEEVLQKKIL